MISIATLIASMSGGCSSSRELAGPPITKPAAVSAKGHTVVAGEPAQIHFTCRLDNGEIAASSDMAEEDANLIKSSIFRARQANTPIVISAGEAADTPDTGSQRGFEAEIIYQLSKAIVGLKTGERQAVTIRAERLPETHKNENFLQIAKVRRRNKEVRLTPEEYRAKTGKTPQTGDSFIIDPAVPGKITSVTQGDVIITFFPAAKVVATPFGEAAVRELADRYEIDIDAHTGTLVRTGPLVGRIVGVDDRFITIDYGHAFGGEPLTCDILVEPARPDGILQPEAR